MKKTIFTIFCTLFVYTSISAAVVSPSNLPKEGVDPITVLLNKLTVDEFIALTPSKIRKETGKKLSLKESIALKMMQKKLKKELKNPSDAKEGGKKQLVAFLLCFFFGIIGVHRFYLGHIGIGIAQILTLGGCGIWALIDFIRIILNDLKTKSGETPEPW